MSSYLGGESLGLADLALFSAVKQLGLDRSVQASEPKPKSDSNFSPTKTLLEMKKVTGRMYYIGIMVAYFTPEVINVQCLQD